MPLCRSASRAALVACALLVLLTPAGAQRLELPEPRQVSAGVVLYHINASSLVSAAEPMSVWLLRLDPAKVELRAALANDEIMGTEVVSTIAERHGALAAINAGFFLTNGDPAGVFTLNGRLVSDTRRPRGAVGILRNGRGTKLVFARLRATASLSLGEGRNRTTVPIDGVDTTRIRGELMLFTPSYNEDTDTAKGGLEWVIDRPRGSQAQPMRVVSGPYRAGRTKIPPGGFVLSFGGEKAPPSLSKLKRGARVALETAYDPLEGEPEPWALAQDIVGGAGLLIRDGRDVEDWTVESFNKGFAEGRHPRTMIGSSSDGTIWLVAIDGRQPQQSVGMTLAELRALAHGLGLVNALNLDGGGSTTMWVQGQVVNRPSDAAGPRKVSDALIVRSLPGAGRQGGTPAR
jgi:Phosphodiester glycosidase